MTSSIAVSPSARLTYLAISAILRSTAPTSSLCISSRRRPIHATNPSRQLRRASSTNRRDDDNSYHRSDFTNQPFTGLYEANETTSGPLRTSSQIGAPRITPSLLKDHLDAFVVGQERAKRTLATAVYNHYQRVQELERRDAEEEEAFAREERRRMSTHPRHPVEGRESELKRGIHVPSLTRDFTNEDEFPGQQSTVGVPGPRWKPSSDTTDFEKDTHKPGNPIVDESPLIIEKSNILLLGPSGVGKTLMARTLARVLEVPFSMSDCTPFTQAGYIGEDVDVCVQRLLAAADYDVAKAERGIICLDEIDKIATAKVSHGKDVSGEGVQQALLKIIEGTTIQVQAKQERNGSPAFNRSSNPLGGPSHSAGGLGGKADIYNVRTDNILFICAGAFNGLHQKILDRLGKGSIGFGAPVRIRPGASASFEDNDNPHETVIEGADELFEQHLPYYVAPLPATKRKNARPRKFNTLDLVSPQDLQAYGLIPELVGRIPISCALSSLSTEALIQVLTEPRHSLLQQYTALMHLSGIELRITTPALAQIAATAGKMGTGARGLRTVMERVLGDAMFEAPGSGVKTILVTEAVAQRKEPVQYFFRGESSKVRKVVEDEEELWEEKQRLAREKESEDSEMIDGEREVPRTFEEYRTRGVAGGFM
ncbi:ATP-dependent Clp protease ATP-binding subunit ClpX [Acrodontium crateriforme]|uniref:ATP-dependent Clp protease ATP-binding subunit ClpX n=1 Tax=Acrodontium crateriforme TaxID=150365 RepID=A0AAQ3RA72_9PEZI|nr:ATP-dependent Clp protease ATP-binding subunit ClpX [Acrodontium crateriforme]